MKKPSRAKPNGERQKAYYHRNKDQILADRQLARFLKTLDEKIEKFRQREEMYDKMKDVLKHLKGVA